MSAVDADAILPRELPPRAVRAASVILVALGLGAGAISALVPFPESATGRFVLAPESGVDPIKAPRSGAVERVAVTEGTEVRAGDVLFELRSEEVLVLAARLPRLESEIEEMGRLDSVLAARHEASRAATVAKAKSYAAERDAAARHAATARRIYEAARKRAEAGVGTQTDAESARLSYDMATREVEAARRSAADAEVAIAELEVERRREISARSLARAQKQGEADEARATLPAALTESKAATDEAPPVRTGDAHPRIDVLEIRAPYAGTVVALGARRVGAQLERGEVLCQIARRGSRLRAELTLADRDAGRIATGQSARLLLDSFPYTRYGARAARLTWVSAAGEDGKFRALAEVSDGVVPLRAGMGGEARVITGHRTLLAMAIDPLRALHERIAPR